MRDSWHEKIRFFLLHRIPLATTLMLMFIFFMPINSVELNYFRPTVGAICVYYWTLKRGYMFGCVSAFWVGLLMDVYSSSPLGLNILFMMLLVLITNWLTRYFQSASFNVCWALFAAVELGQILLKWVILTAYFGHLLSLSEVMISYFSTLMFYPLIVSFNVWVQNKFLPQERINE